MDGQAYEAPEMIGVGELADLLSDNPETEPEDEKESEQATEEEADDQQDDTEEDSDSEEAPETPTTDRTFKVKVQGEDGAEVEREVPEKELIDGYMMRSDYTRKTQELAEREKTVTQQLSQKHEEIRNHYLQEATLARAAITQFAGLKTQQEMAQLAQDDPAAWVVENQRQQQTTMVLRSLDERIRNEQAESAQQTQALTRELYESAWAELQKDGIDRTALGAIYQEACKSYGFSMDDFASVYDPRAVRVLKDNAAMRKELTELKAKAKTVTKQVQDAPRIPNKQAQAVNERKARSLESRFKNGTAKLNDLAALLS